MAGGGRGTGGGRERVVVVSVGWCREDQAGGEREDGRGKEWQVGHRWWYIVAVEDSRTVYCGIDGDNEEWCIVV